MAHALQFLQMMQQKTSKFNMFFFKINDYYFSLLINGSIFFGNQGYSVSNCVYFVGFRFSLFYSIFANNNPLDTLPLLISPGKGGCLEVSGIKVFVKFNEFIGNKKSRGGAVYFNSIQNFLCSIMVSNSLFLDNYALFGGGLYLHSDHQIVFILESCYFKGNWAIQSKFIF